MESNVNPAAFAYCRVSKEDGPAGQGKQGVLDQKKVIEDAFGKKYDVVRWFIDQDVSRRTYFDERPEGRKLLGAVYDGGPDVVLISNADRLGLSKQSHTFLGQCHRAGVKVLLPDGTDLTTDYIQAGIGAIVSEQSYSDLVGRLQAARKRLHAEGKRMYGRWEFGRHPNHAYDDEREVLKKMLDMHAKGESFYAIAKHLNDHDVKTRMGTRWYLASVARIIRRELAKSEKK